MEIGAEQQALEDFRDELDVRDEDIYNEEKQLQIRNINQMVYVTRKQVLNVLEQIMFSHPVSVKGPRANLIARGGTYEGYFTSLREHSRCSSNEYYPHRSNEAIRCFHG